MTALGRTARETLREFWDEIRAEERRYHELCLKVVGKDGKVVPFKLRRPQERSEDLISKCRAHSIPIRLAQAKYRQLGNTVYWSGVVHRRIMTRENHTAHIVAHRKSRVQKVLRLQKFFIKNLPKKLQPEIESDNKETLVLADRNSQVGTSSATDPEGIRGDTILTMLFTEAAYYGDKGGSLKQLMTSALEAVPEPHVIWDTLVVAESTGNGTDDEFYDFFKAAIEGEGLWQGMFLEWFKDPEYERSFHVDPVTRKCVHLEKATSWEHLKALRDDCKTCHKLRMAFRSEVLDNDADLKARWQRFGLTYEQINFYFLKLAGMNGDRLKMQQEYPCTWQEAFIASGTPVFDVQLLTRIKDFQKPGKLFEIPMDVNSYADLTPNSQLRRNKEPYLEIWEKPNPNKTYIIPADSSEGKNKSNPSAAHVYELESMCIVAEMHGLIEPDPYGDYLMRLGHIYNDAMLGPERQYSGVAVINKILQENYPSLYQKHRLTPAGWEETDTPGWDTNLQTKPWIVALMRKMLFAHKDNPQHLARMFPSACLVDDLMKFTRAKMGVTRAKYGAEDDRPMSAMIGLGICHQELGLGLGDQVVSGVKTPKEKHDRERQEEEKAKSNNISHAEHTKQMRRFFAGNEDADDEVGIIGDFDYED